MTKDEMKNRISIALKDPILQQGFEIICAQLTKAKEIIKDYMIVSSNVTVCSVPEENRCINVLKLNEEAEKFIRDVENGQMTDEEKAEQWLDERYLKDMGVKRPCKEAYLAGLMEGKPKWHKVADGDYPPCEKGNYTINVLTDRGDIAYYNYDMECWVAEPSSAEIDPPVAWCELPKYTKENEQK